MEGLLEKRALGVPRSGRRLNNALGFVSHVRSSMSWYTQRVIRSQVRQRERNAPRVSAERGDYIRRLRGDPPVLMKWAPGRAPRAAATGVMRVTLIFRLEGYNVFLSIIKTTEYTANID